MDGRKSGADLSARRLPVPPTPGDMVAGPVRAPWPRRRKALNREYPGNRRRRASGSGPDCPKVQRAGWAYVPWGGNGRPGIAGAQRPGLTVARGNVAVRLFLRTGPGIPHALHGVPAGPPGFGRAPLWNRVPTRIRGGSGETLGKRWSRRSRSCLTARYRARHGRRVCGRSASPRPPGPDPRCWRMRQ